MWPESQSLAKMLLIQKATWKSGLWRHWLCLCEYKDHRFSAGHAETISDFGTKCLLLFFFRQAMQIGEQIKRSVNKRHSKASYFNSIFVAHQLDLVQWRGSIQVARYKRLEIEIDGVFAATSGKKLLRAAISLFHSGGHIDTTQGAVDASQEEEICCDEGGSPGWPRFWGPKNCIVTPAMLRWWTGKTNSLKPKSKVGADCVHGAFRQHHGVHLADLKAWDNSWGLDIVRRDWCGLAKDMGEANVRGCLLLCQSRPTVYQANRLSCSFLTIQIVLHIHDRCKSQMIKQQLYTYIVGCRWCFLFTFHTPICLQFSIFDTRPF